MKQTLIVSCCSAKVTVRYFHSPSQKTFRFEKTDTGFPIAVWNFFPAPPLRNREMVSLWIKNQQLQFGRLLMELRRHGFSRSVIFDIVCRVYDEPVEWLAEEGS